MLTASLFEDLQSIQWLIIALLIVAVVFYFRDEIRLVMRRLSKLEARRKDTAISASLDREPHEPNHVGAASSAAPEEHGAGLEEEAAAATTADGDSHNAEEVRRKMIRANLAGNKAEGDKLFNRLESLESDSAERRRDRVRQLATQVVGGIDSDGLESLEHLAETEEDQGFVYSMIGLCFEATEKPAEAAAARLKAVELAKTQKDRVIATVNRASSLSKLGEDDIAIEELLNLLREEPDRGLREELTQALADAYKSAGEAELSALSRYQVAAIAGNDASKWFSAGYALSQIEKNQFTILIVHCYMMALTFDSTQQFAKNNLGVILAGSDLPIMATRYYKEATELGNTLSSANMAQNYLWAGFSEDATKILEDATEQPNPHEKVAHVTAEVARNSRSEKDKLQRMKDAGPRVGHLMSSYLDARNRATPSIEGTWTLDDTAVSITVSGPELVVSWDAGGAVGGRRFKGELAGAGVVGRFEKQRLLPGLAESWEADGVGYGAISDGAGAIHLVKLDAGMAEYLNLAPAGPDGEESQEEA